MIRKRDGLAFCSILITGQGSIRFNNVFEEPNGIISGIQGIILPMEGAISLVIRNMIIEIANKK